MKTSLLPTLAFALALASPALAQTTGAATQEPSQSAATTAHEQNTQTNENAQHASHESNLLTINKLKQDLQSAGFTDVKIFADSFVVQAKDKDGNPTIMSLSPSGVVAFSELSQQREAKASAKTSNQGSETQRR